MKIVIINGSPRKQGATASILHKLEGEIRNHENVDVEFVDLADLNIAQCKGCCVCYRTGKCIMEDDGEELSKTIAAADGLIMGSPTYASNVSGLMKTFIDRGHFVIEQSLHGKYAISVATGENHGNRDTTKILVKLLQYSGALLSGRIIYKTPFNAPIRDFGLDRKVQRLANRLYWDIREKRRHPLQKTFHNMIFALGIRRFVVRKGDSYQGVIDRWKQQGVVETMYEQ